MMVYSHTHSNILSLPRDSENDIDQYSFFDCNLIFESFRLDWILLVHPIFLDFLRSFTCLSSNIFCTPLFVIAFHYKTRDPLKFIVFPSHSHLNLTVIGPFCNRRFKNQLDLIPAVFDSLNSPYLKTRLKL